MDLSPVFTYPDGVDTDTYAQTIQRPKKPDGPADLVLDTDTYNEIDDQYALAYLLASQARGQVRVRGIFAAPFRNHHASNTRDGMEKSYAEILRVLELTGHSHLAPLVFRGADRFLPDEQTPVDSPAARELIRLAMEHTPEKPLYVACIAAPTNIASAILLQPAILDRIVVVWSGGVGLGWPDCQCFNGGQSVAASRVVLGSGVPIVLTPGRAVADRLLTTGPELEYWLRGKNRFCDYIVDRTIQEASLVDGCGNWRFFWKILMPMSSPVLATVFISSFVNSWTTYLWPLIVTNIEEMRTVQVIITMLNVSDLNSAYGQVMAASVLILIPSVAIFTLSQRKITAGMMSGAVKE